MPNRLQIQKKILDTHPSIICVGSDTELIDEKGRFLTTLIHKRGSDISRGIQEGHGEISNPASMVRTDILKKVGGHHEGYTYADDLDVWLRLDEVGDLENLPIPLTQYRVHSNSASEKFGVIQRESALRACQDAWKRRNIQGNFTAGSEWRPTGTRTSRLEFTLNYGWLAWNSKKNKTAFIYGFKAIMLDVFSKNAWQLLYCAIIRKSK